ncbi:MAG: hypothetical protein AAFV25_09510, partial [Bacteroidota bacterium]
MRIHCIEMKQTNWKIQRPEYLLPSNHTDVWLIDLRRLKAEDWIFLASNLREDELEKSRSCTDESERQRFIAARAVLRQL